MLLYQYGWITWIVVQDPAVSVIVRDVPAVKTITVFTLKMFLLFAVSKYFMQGSEQNECKMCNCTPVNTLSTMYISKTMVLIPLFIGGLD